MKDSRIVTMEVEARNLDKKVCLERSPGGSRIKGQEWCLGGGRGFKNYGGGTGDWQNGCLSLSLTLGSLCH